MEEAEYYQIKDVIKDTGELVPAGYGDGMINEIIKNIVDDKVLTLEPHLFIFEAYKNIDHTEMKHRFTFNSADEAFDFAVAALKRLLSNAGYIEKDGEYFF